MQEVIAFLLRHGYAVLVGAVFLEQIGLPFPAVPVMLAVGALAGDGTFSFPLALLLATAAALLADLPWYWLGRTRGVGALRLLCRLSLEPDYCVSRTKDIFGRFGSQGLLLAKFFPGFSTIAPPMAGITRLALPHFLWLDLIGCLLWAGTYLGLGFVLHNQLESVSQWLTRTGYMVGIVLAALIIGYAAWVWAGRVRLLRALRLARISPEELKGMLDRHADVWIIDLRLPYDHPPGAPMIKGALRILPAELHARRDEIPIDRDVVVYCS